MFIGKAVQVSIHECSYSFIQFKICLAVKPLGRPVYNTVFCDKLDTNFKIELYKYQCQHMIGRIKEFEGD